MTQGPFETVTGLVDQANAADPTMVLVGGQAHPAELIYGQRMSARLADFAETRDEAGMIVIIARTWRKMSKAGHAAALAMTVPPALAELVGEGVSQAA